MNPVYKAVIAESWSEANTELLKVHGNDLDGFHRYKMFDLLSYQIFSIPYVHSIAFNYADLSIRGLERLRAVLTELDFNSKAIEDLIKEKI